MKKDKYLRVRGGTARMLDNPYLGDDVMRPFAELPDKAAIVTVKTSNPDAAIVQDVILQDGRPLWKYILELMVNRWNGAGNMIPVIGSTTDIDLSGVREIIPDEMPVLFGGYGVQGGTTKHLRQLLDSERRGVFVNSSRGILYPYDIQERSDTRNANSMAGRWASLWI